MKQSSKSFTPAPPLHIPQDDCPLSQQVVCNLAEAEVDEDSTGVVEELSNLFMWGNVKHKTVPRHCGEAIENPMRRLQFVLELLKEQRDLHIARLQGRHDARLRDGQRGFTFTDEDMKEVLNTWRYDARTWMNEDSLRTWWTLTRDEAHGFVKKRFNAMKFHLLGNSALVDITIRCNLIGAVQPAALREFMRLWEEYRETPTCRHAHEASVPRPSWKPQRYARIKELREKIDHAERIKKWIDKDWNHWFLLSDVHKRLYQDYCAGALHYELNAVKQIPIGSAFPGAASNIMSAGQPALFNSTR